MLGYALAKLNFPGKRILFVVVLATLMVPAVVTFMPLFVLVANLGLVNTHAGMILPFMVGAFGVFLMRQFIMGLPDELLDAARVDGAGEHYIFWRIIMPLCGPALATLAILTFLASWNSFLWPWWSQRARTCSPCRWPSRSSPRVSRRRTSRCSWPDPSS